jgi:copper resistance protein B
MSDEPPTYEEVVGDAPPPAVPADHAADRYFSTGRMAASRSELQREDRITYAQVLVERLELQARAGKAGYAWQGEASSGTDRDRLVIASEGQNEPGRGLEEAELHAKWRHAIDPWFNAELGVRYDLRPDPQRTYLIVGVEGLAPYWIDTEAQLFVSNKGEVQARLQLAVDQRITQRLVLRPAAEIDLSLQDVPELGITSRVPEWSLGARLRYELKANLAPYVGVEWRRDLADPNRDQSRDHSRRTGANVVVGVRAWF